MIDGVETLNERVARGYGGQAANCDDERRGGMSVNAWVRRD